MRELLTRTLGPRVSVCFQLDPADVSVMSEPTQLELALLNLALNARDAMPQGGSLTISTTSCRIESSLDLQPGDYVRLSVADTGVGMTAEVVARAFDPFYSTKEVGKGTGLGLSQVFGLARTGGGTATIDSRPSEGTTVHMFLRVADTSPSPPAQISRQDEAHVSGGRALIIDDDDDVRAVLIDLLTDLGWDTSHAASGPTGLAMLDQVKPDVVVVDFAMPELNGAEVARRARIARPDLPIIFITGYADMAEINGVIDVSAVLLHKPFTTQDLQVALGRVSLAQQST